MNTAERYQNLVEEIESCALAAGRSPREVQLVAVSKTFPLEQILPVYQAGCRDFGENRIADALAKREAAPPDIRWHYVGALQRNKVKKVVGHFHLIHSIDNQSLAEALSAESQASNSVTSILLQVNISGETTKRGFAEEECKELFSSLAVLPGICIQGLMTMAPQGCSKEGLLEIFHRLRLFRDALQEQEGHALPHLSMGMTEDFPQAIQAGATLVRIGRRIFGERVLSL